MFYVDIAGNAATVNAAVAAMTSSRPSAVETPMLTAIQALVTAAVNATPGTQNYTGNFQVLIRGGFKAGTTELSVRINSVEVDTRGNVRMGSTATRANAYTP